MEIRRVELLASAVQKQRSTTELYPRLSLTSRPFTPFVNQQPTAWGVKLSRARDGSGQQNGSKIKINGRQMNGLYWT